MFSDEKLYFYTSPNFNILLGSNSSITLQQGLCCHKLHFILLSSRVYPVLDCHQTSKSIRNQENMCSRRPRVSGFSLKAGTFEPHRAIPLITSNIFCCTRVAAFGRTEMSSQGNVSPPLALSFLFSRGSRFSMQASLSREFLLLLNVI